MANHKKWDTPAEARRAATLAWRARNPEKYKERGSRPRPLKRKKYCEVCEKHINHVYFPRHLVAPCHLKKVEDLECEVKENQILES